MKYLLIGLTLMISANVLAQTKHQNLRRGDQNYYKNEYEKAEDRYRKALEEDPNSVKGLYNLGNAIYNQERFEEAMTHYQAATENAANDVDKANAYYNLGNAYLSQLNAAPDPSQRQNLIEQSINAYKETLKINPKDPAAKHNLAYAQHLKKRLEQQQQQNQNQENNDNSKQNQEQQPPQGNPSKADDGEQQEQPQPQQNQNQEEKEEKTPPPPGKMTKEEAEQYLKKMEDEERKAREKMNEKPQKGRKKKDW